MPSMMTKQSGDADGPRQQMTVEIPQRGEAELSGVDVCIHQDIFRTLTALAPKHQSWIDVKKVVADTKIKFVCGATF